NVLGKSGPLLESLPAAGSSAALEPGWQIWFSLGISPGELLCFFVFWLINVFFIWKGTESIKWMEALAAPFLIVAGLVLLAWAILRVGSLATILSAKSSFATNAEFWRVFFPSLTANVGFWATLSLNIPDFARFAKSQREQVLGQAIGLPPTMALFAFIGVAVTAATPHMFGEIITDPVALLARVGGLVTTLVAMVALSLATLSTNIAANVVSPANDFSNLRPNKISYKMGGYITAVIGILIMPWKLLAAAGTYLFIWLIGYSALLGPIGGVLIVDYYVLRKKVLIVDDLYRRGGAYEYDGGVHRAAIVATLLGMLPNVPGFAFTLYAGGVRGRAEYLAGLATRKGETLASFAGISMSIYDYAWFVGFGLAALIYWLLAKKRVLADIAARAVAASPLA
ncbi:MAG: nitrate reductase, partial [Myxococcales bacterium]|nr:nitrate reductase [Myxococcales bacterium]